MGWHARWQRFVFLRLASENSQMNSFCHPRGKAWEVSLKKKMWKDGKTLTKRKWEHSHFLTGILQEFSMSFLHLRDNHCQLFRWIQNCRGVNIVCSIYQAVLEDICDWLGLLWAQLPLCGHSLFHLLSIQNFCVKIYILHSQYYFSIFTYFLSIHPISSNIHMFLIYAGSYSQT